MRRWLCFAVLIAVSCGGDPTGGDGELPPPDDTPNLLLGRSFDITTYDGRSGAEELRRFTCPAEAMEHLGVLELGLRLELRFPQPARHGRDVGDLGLRARESTHVARDDGSSMARPSGGDGRDELEVVDACQRLDSIVEAPLPSVEHPARRDGIEHRLAPLPDRTVGVAARQEVLHCVLVTAEGQRDPPRLPEQCRAFGPFCIGERSLERGEGFLGPLGPDLLEGRMRRRLGESHPSAPRAPLQRQLFAPRGNLDLEAQASVDARRVRLHVGAIDANDWGLALDPQPDAARVDATEVGRVGRGWIPMVRITPQRDIEPRRFWRWVFSLDRSQGHDGPRGPITRPITTQR